MKFIEYVVMAALLVPTASVIAAMVISLTSEPAPPAEAGVQVTSPAVYYADTEKQP
jgi:hypothetical protein